ncbi:putative inorganic pyrophosphatase-like, partial [Apostichopus japonicus]
NCPAKFATELSTSGGKHRTYFASTMAYRTVERGPPNSLDYRVYFQDESGKIVSPFHDIPLFANAEKTVFNMVVEVPRWTNAKMEISVKGEMNPIKQDVKKGKLRYVKNCFPHHGYIWNYGALPQTWEDPNHTDKDTKCKGDNDPLDVCEIGYKVAARGEVMKVKVLGTLAMIDEGETDWKILAINVDDPLAEKLNDIADIQREMPGFIESTFEWFKIYKVPDGKPLNTFAFDSKPKDKAFALNIIEQTHGQWRELITGRTDACGISLKNVSVKESVGDNKISADVAKSIVDDSPQPGDANPISPEVDKWHYVASQ